MVLDSGGSRLLCRHPQHDRRLAEGHLQADKGRGTRLMASSPLYTAFLSPFSFSLIMSVCLYPPPCASLCFLPSVSFSGKWRAGNASHAVTVPHFQFNICAQPKLITMIGLIYNSISHLQSKQVYSRRLLLWASSEREKTVALAQQNNILVSRYIFRAVFKSK